MLNVKLLCQKCGFESEEYIPKDKIVVLSCSNCKEKIAELKPARGLVYILSNPCMAGLVKIGFTKRNINDRVAELNGSTSIPEPFIVEATFHSTDPQGDEQKAHTALREYRNNSSREFFKLESVDAIRLVTEVLGRLPGTKRDKSEPDLPPLLRKQHEPLKAQQKSSEQNGLFTYDQGSHKTPYSYSCPLCNKRFFSTKPCSLSTSCPHCFNRYIDMRWLECKSCHHIWFIKRSIILDPPCPKCNLGNAIRHSTPPNI